MRSEHPPGNCRCARENRASTFSGDDRGEMKCMSSPERNLSGKGAKARGGALVSICCGENPAQISPCCYVKLSVTYISSLPKSMRGLKINEEARRGALPLVDRVVQWLPSAIIRFSHVQAKFAPFRARDSHSSVGPKGAKGLNQMLGRTSIRCSVGVR